MVLRARAELSAQRARNCGCSGTSSRLLYSRLRRALSGAFIDYAASLPSLSPKAHGFLPRAVGEGEQRRFRFRLQLERRPRRHDEDVARLEIEALAADLGGSAAFDRAVDRAVGAAVGLAPERFRQQLQERGDGGHGMPAGERVDVLEFPAVARIRILVLGDLRERLAAARVRVGEDRRSPAVRRGTPVSGRLYVPDPVGLVRSKSSDFAMPDEN